MPRDDSSRCPDCGIEHDALTRYVERMNDALYGPCSVFTPEEQAAMRRGYTLTERRRISGRIFGQYPQAVSETHARKLDAINTRIWVS